MSNRISDAISIVTTAWVPETPLQAFAAVGAAWYGYKVAQVHAHTLVTQYILGPTSMGGIFDSLITSPLITPTQVARLTPWVTVGIAFTCIYATVATIKVATAIFRFLKSSPLAQKCGTAMRTYVNAAGTKCLSLIDSAIISVFRIKVSS